MTILLDLSLPRTIDAIVSRFADGKSNDWQVEAWLFEDAPARRRAEAMLAAEGVRAVFRSAYKPLVHWFLEAAPGFLEEAPEGEVTVRLPSHAAAPEGRFRLEAYPLAGMLPGVALRFSAGDAALDYGVGAHSVFAPNRARTDHLGQSVLSPCGWLRVRDAQGALVEDGPVETEFEAVFARIMAAVAGWNWPAAAPYFEVLAIDVAMPGIERAIGVGDEVLSTREALHEDLYFSLLEWFKQRAGMAAADRRLQPGQIVPDIRASDGAVTVRVTLRAASAADNVRPGPMDLEDADRPLTPGQIGEELERLGGRAVAFRSFQGRDLPARVFLGAGPAVLIGAGQHANETSGVVGALRAARVLRDQSVTFAVMPCENPDGYALHHALRAHNPRHMHHAARYSALGDDVEAREAAPWHEKAARNALIAEIGAGLHINLHGYPAHEWTRPLTGYLPRGFELWTIPKGFFLIMRHHPGVGARVMGFLEALTAVLTRDTALAAFNARQLAVWEAHAGALACPVLNGIPCMVSESDRQRTAFQLITEYPDETIYGAAFQLAQRTQMRATVEAVRLFRAGALGLPQPGV